VSDRPGAGPSLWWSPSWGAVIEQHSDGHYEVTGEPAVPLPELPADAVRLVADIGQAREPDDATTEGNR
jgi:hypothetical protein